MAVSGQQIYPVVSGDDAPTSDGLRREIWRLTGDGSATTYALTPSTMRTIVAVHGGGMSTHSIAPPTAGYLGVATSVTLTWDTALGNGLYQDVVVEGLA